MNNTKKIMDNSVYVKNRVNKDKIDDYSKTVYQIEKIDYCKGCDLPLKPSQSVAKLKSYALNIGIKIAKFDAKRANAIFNKDGFQFGKVTIYSRKSEICDCSFSEKRKEILDNIKNLKNSGNVNKFGIIITKERLKALEIAKKLDYLFENNPNDHRQIENLISKLQALKMTDKTERDYFIA